MLHVRYLSSFEKLARSNLGTSASTCRSAEIQTRRSQSGSENLFCPMQRGAALALPSLDPDPQYPCSCSCSARSLTFVSLYPFIVGTAMTTSPSYVLATHTHIPLESGRQMGTAGSHMHDKFPYSDFNAIVCKEGGREGGEADPSLPLPLPSSFPVFHFGLTTTTTPTTTATCVNQCSCPVSVYSECEWKCDDASRGGRRCRAVEMRREFLPHLPYITSSLVLSPAV